MHFITLDSETDFDGWRKAARALVLNEVKPADVTWTVQGNAAELFAAEPQRRRPNRRQRHLQRPRQIRRTRTIRDPASRPRAVCDPVPAAVAAARPSRSARGRDRSRRGAGYRDGQGGAPRRAQDACLCPLPRSRPRTERALRRLVRTRASHRRTGGAVLRPPLRRHAVVDPDAGRLRALGRPRGLDSRRESARPRRRPKTGWRKPGGAITPASSIRPGSR